MEVHVQTTTEQDNWNMVNTGSSTEHARECNPSSSHSLQPSPHLEVQKPAGGTTTSDPHESEMVAPNQRMVESNNAYSPQFHGCNGTTEVSAGQLFTHRDEVK